MEIGLNDKEDIINRMDKTIAEGLKFVGRDWKQFKYRIEQTKKSMIKLGIANRTDIVVDILNEVKLKKR